MKWFQHFSDSYTNLKMQEIFEEFGIMGYGIFWLSCELVAQQGIDYQIDNNKNWKKALTNISKTPTDQIDRILLKCADLNLIDKKAFEKNCLFIPKMAEYSDDYTKKLRRVSEHYTDNVRPDKITLHKITKDKSIYTPEFESFFKSYPRKEDKQPAFKEWQKIKPSPELITKIMAGLEKHKQTEKWQEGYIVYACKFLKNRNWEDEIKVEPKREILRLKV